MLLSLWHKVVPELIALPLLPLLTLQGRRTRTQTLKLQPLSGPSHGRVNSGAGDHTSRPLRLLMVGESPVAGIGVQTWSESITAAFARALSDALSRSVEWRAIGQDGARVNDALSQMLPDLSVAMDKHDTDAIGEPESFDLVCIAFGVNDTTGFTPVSRWIADMNKLLDGLEQRYKGCLFLLSGVPPLQHFPALPAPLRWVLGMKSSALDHALVKIALRRERTFHAQLPHRLREPTMMAADAYHPAAAGCTVWAAALTKACLPYLTISEKITDGQAAGFRR